VSEADFVQGSGPGRSAVKRALLAGGPGGMQHFARSPRSVALLLQKRASHRARFASLRLQHPEGDRGTLTAREILRRVEQRDPAGAAEAMAAHIAGRRPDERAGPPMAVAERLVGRRA